MPDAVLRPQLARRIKLAGVVLLVALFVLAFVQLIRWGAVGVAVVCLGIGAACVAIGWRRPRVGGAVLVAASILLILPVLSAAHWAIAYASGNESWGRAALVTLVFLGPIFVIGLTFLLAGSIAAGSVRRRKAS